MNDSIFLNPQESSSIKGLLASMVLISHLSARVELFSNSILGTMFSAFGYLAVSMFFFLSGFGLYQRYRKCGEGYMRSFLMKRILPYYTMCCTVILIYFIRDLLVTGSVDWVVLAQSFLFGKTIVDMGWYLQAQLILYFIFLLAFRFAKNNQILWIIILTGIYCIFCAAAGMYSTWYEAVFGFAFGMLCAKYKDKIFSELRNFRKIIWMGSFLALAFLGTLFFGNKQILPDSVRICVKMISALCFDGLIVLIAAYIKFTNPITRFLGNYSLEIYVLQGLFLYGLRPIIHNDWLYILLVIAATVILSLIFHPVFRFVNRLASEGVKPKSKGV